MKTMRDISNHLTSSGIQTQKANFYVTFISNWQKPVRARCLFVLELSSSNVSQLTKTFEELLSLGVPRRGQSSAASTESGKLDYFW